MSNPSSAPPGAATDPPESRAAAPPDIVPMDTAGDPTGTQGETPSRHQNKRARLSEDSEDEEEAAAAVQTSAEQATPPPPARTALAPATQASNTASATAANDATHSPGPLPDRSLAASAHAPSPGRTGPAPAPALARAAGPTAAAADALLRDAADRAMAAGAAKARVFGGLVEALNGAEDLRGIAAGAARFLREAGLFAAKLDAAPAVDDAKLERLLACMRSWDNDDWAPPSPPAAPTPIVGTSSRPAAGPPGTDAFPALPGRAAHSGASTRKAPALEALRGMVVAGGGRNSAYNVAASGGRKDRRVLLRLPLDSPRRHASERSLCQALNDKLTELGCAHKVRISQVKKTGSGLALTPAPGCSTDELYAHSSELESVVGASGSARHEQWDKYVIAEVATRDGDEVIGMDEVRRDLESFLGLQLMEAPRRLGTADHLMGADSSPVIFALARGALSSRRRPTSHVCVLGARHYLRPYREERAPSGCPRCLEYTAKHDVAACSGPARCARCGKEGHSTEEHTCGCGGESCECLPRCWHCHGSHPALSPICPARPFYSQRARAVVFYKGASLERIRAVEGPKRAKEARAQRGRRAAARGLDHPAADADGFTQVRTRSQRRNAELQASTPAQALATTGAGAAGQGGAAASVA